GNPSALATSVYVHLNAATFYELSGKPKERDAALSIARKDATDLARFPELSHAALTRGVFLQYDGQEEEAFKVWEDGVRHQEVGINLAAVYGLELYRRGGVETALEFLDSQIPANLYYRDYTRAIILAETPNGPARAREIYDRLIAEHPVMWMEWVSILLWLG